MYSSPRISSLFYRFYVGSECGSRSNCLRKTDRPCLYDLSYGATWARMGLHYFIDFMSEASVDWGRIVVAKPASPVSMISHMNGLEAQISSIFRRFRRKEMDFNCCCRIGSPAFSYFKIATTTKRTFICCCSIDSLVFLLWKWLISGWRRIFSWIVAYFKR